MVGCGSGLDSRGPRGCPLLAAAFAASPARPLGPLPHGRELAPGSSRVRLQLRFRGRLVERAARHSQVVVAAAVVWCERGRAAGIQRPVHPGSSPQRARKLGAAALLAAHGGQLGRRCRRAQRRASLRWPRATPHQSSVALLLRVGGCSAGPGRSLRPFQRSGVAKH